MFTRTRRRDSHAARGRRRRFWPTPASAWLLEERRLLSNVITFDDLPVGTTVEHQYHSLGVDFTGRLPVIAAVPAGQAQSGGQVANITVAHGGEEFPPAIATGTLTDPRQRVSVDVGEFSYPGLGPAYVTLRAFDAAGGLVAQTGPVTVLQGDGFHTLLSVHSDSANISSFEVSGRNNGWPVGIDDLSLDPPPPPPDFTITPDESSLDLVPGQSTSVSISITHLYGSSGAVSFAASGLPAGVTANFTPGTTTDRTTLTLTVAPDVPYVSYLRPATILVTATPLTPSAGTVLHSVPLVVSDARPGISAVSPEAGWTPVALQPGTEIVLTGSHLAPDLVVQFGNEYARVTGSVNAAMTELRVRVPRLATSGRLTLLAPDGTLLATAPISFDVHSFRNTDGFAFVNLGVRDANFSYSDDIELFGYLGTTIGGIFLPLPNVPALVGFNALADRLLAGGLCYGISLAGERLLHGDESFGAFPPQPGLSTPAVWNLDGTTGPSSSLLHYIELQHVAQWSSEALHHYGAEVASHIFNGAASIRDEITGALQHGDFPMIGMQDGGGHAVVAYDIEDDGSGGYYIDVYDPNVPFTTGEDRDPNAHRQAEGFHDDGGDHGSRIHVSLDGHWDFPNLGWNGTATSLEVTTYGVVPVQPTFPGNGATGLLTLLFGGTAQTTQVTDSQGHTLLGPNGTNNTNPATRIPGAVRYEPEQGAGAGSVPVADYLGDTETYTQAVHESTPGTFSGLILGDGFGVDLSGIPSTPGVDDTLTTDAASAGFRFQTTALSKPLTIDLTAKAGDGAVRAVSIRTTSFAAGTDGFRFDPPRQAFSYSHAGPATAFTLTLSSVDPSGRPVSFASPKLTIGPGDTVTFKPSDWRHLDSAPITLSLLHAGGRSESVDLSPQGRARILFVTSLYQTLLDRVPTMDELASWTGKLAAGQSPRKVATVISKLEERRALLKRHAVPRVAVNQALKRALSESGLTIGKSQSRQGRRR
jgi:hypothetical protein